MRRPSGMGERNDTQAISGKLDSRLARSPDRWRARRCRVFSNACCVTLQPDSGWQTVADQPVRATPTDAVVLDSRGGRGYAPCDASCAGRRVPRSASNRVATPRMRPSSDEGMTVSSSVNCLSPAAKQPTVTDRRCRSPRSGDGEATDDTPRRNTLPLRTGTVHCE